MAKLEIPSIVVQSGTHSPPKMDRATRSRQWSMSQQSTCDEDCELVVGVAETAQTQDTTTPVTPVTTSPAQTNNTLTRSRSKNSLKLLKRSQAVNESTSPPPDLPPSPVNTTPAPSTPPINNNNNNTATTVNNNKKNTDSLGPNTRPTMKREGSNNSCDSNRSGHLSRGNSCDQSAEVSVEKWIVDKINSNKKDCNFMLKLESDFLNLIKDQKKSSLKYDPLPAYQRMIVHKCSEYYGLEHNTIKESMMVISKPKIYTPIEKKISDLIDRDLTLPDEEPRKSILKRDSASFEESLSFKMNGINTYEKGRQQWPQANCWLSDSTKLHPNQIPMARKLRKNESYESNELLKANSLRQTTTINKAHSFGGYDDPTTTNNRVLTKQDSGSSVSSRVSPGSSGYKSLRSDATLSATPSPTATPHLTTQLSSQSEVSPDTESEAVVWAVTSINSVPTGSVLINPQTGQPLVNADGSIYHFDPANPPNLHIDSDDRLSRRTPSSPREEEEPLPTSHNHLLSDSSDSTSNFVDSDSGEGMHNSMVPPAVHHSIPAPPVAATHSTVPAPAHFLPYPLSTPVTPVHPLPSLMYSPSPPYTMGMGSNEQFSNMMQGSNMPPMMYGLPTSQYSSLPITQTPVTYDRSPLAVENSLQSYESAVRMMVGLNLGEGRTRTPLYVPPQQQQTHFAAPQYPQGPQQFYLTHAVPPTPATLTGQHLRYAVAPSYATSPDRTTGDWMQQSPPSLAQPFYRGQGNAAPPMMPFSPAAGGYGVGVMPFHLSAPRGAYHSRMPTPPGPGQPPLTQFQHNSFPVYSSGYMVPQYGAGTHNQGGAMHMSVPQVMRTPSQLGVGSPPVRVSQTSTAPSSESSLMYMRSAPAPTQPPMTLMQPALRPILGAKPQGRAILGSASLPMAARPMPTTPHNNNKRHRRNVVKPKN